ncbi:hypothetical protein PHYNN_22 [Pantoea phage Phynn]|nr:hypothetical protein PHYNN_22 [Pantoea phage Phynn]
MQMLTSLLAATWRIGNNTHTLLEILYAVGLNRVIGRTCDNSSMGTSLDERGYEIQAWIDAFGCKNYVILDDDRDMLESQKNNFILTDGQIGLTEEQSTFAIRKIFGINKSFCPECNGYGRVEEFVHCGSCNVALE